jgi:hypothetical protein
MYTVTNNADKMASTLYKGEKPMEVLWGAWAQRVNFDEEQHTVDIIGVYDEIWKYHKSDFPLNMDLQVILAYQANRAEFKHTYKLTLDFIDRFADNHLFLSTQKLIVYSGDEPFRWYETYMLRNIEIREPDYYELLVSIDRRFTQRIPLWVLMPGP